ncbi:6-O-methylguanine DNA methyltransferase [Baffinella frigidus]|nr:6-O-methylguanine DNA methyltransferase [Cryptophyta sp. CCMP2293]
MPILKSCAGMSAGANAGEPLSEANPQVSEYELQREANIQRNQQLLISLGLQAPPTHEPSPATPPTSRKRPRDSSALTASTQPRRSARTPTESAPEGGPGRVDPPATPAKSVAAEVSVTSGAEPFEAGAAAGALRPVGIADSAKAAGSSSLFAQRVLQVVQAIPRGKVASYGQCAAMAGSPNSARQVGKLLALGLARGGAAPWQRVVNASGSVSSGFL